jgi:hypothetical protein
MIMLVRPTESGVTAMTIVVMTLPTQSFGCPTFNKEQARAWIV